LQIHATQVVTFWREDDRRDPGGFTQLICAQTDGEVMKVEEGIDDGAGPAEPRHGMWNFQSPADGRGAACLRGFVVYCLGELNDVFACVFENMRGVRCFRIPYSECE
jgi:hypothetical protein